MEKKKPKIICFDIENAPNLHANLGSLLCIGYKEIGDKETKCIAAWDFARWKRSTFDDYEICKAIVKEFADADGFVYHYGERHDLPYLNSRLMKNGFAPLAPVASIDTWKVAKYKLKLHSNRLKTLAEFLEVKGPDGELMNKQDVGWDLWLKVLNRHKDACKKMVEYCKRDVDVLEACFFKLRPLIKNVPNYSLFRENARVCPTCGAARLTTNGQRATRTGMVQRLRCHGCGSSHREKNGKIVTD